MKTLTVILKVSLAIALSAGIYLVISSGIKNCRFGCDFGPWQHWQENQTIFRLGWLYPKEQRGVPFEETVQGKYRVCRRCNATEGELPINKQFFLNPVGSLTLKSASNGCPILSDQQ